VTETNSFRPKNWVKVLVVMVVDWMVFVQVTVVE